MATAQSTSLLVQPGKSHGWLKSISILSLVAVFGLIVLGGAVRVTGSGLGCPDWPTCHGQWIPPWEFTAVMEYSHRLVASAIVGPMILLTAGTVWIAYRKEPWLTVPASLAVVLLIIQSLLGAVTVLRELPGEIVALHLAVAQLIVACLVMIAVVTFRGPLRLQGVSNRLGRPYRFPLLAAIAAVGVYLLVISGAIVTGSGATAACVTWPLCQGQVFPQLVPQAIHMGHRFIAAIVGLYLVYVLIKGIRESHASPDVPWLSATVAGLFIAQVAVGAITIFARFPIELIATHMALGTAVWGTIAALAMVTLTRPETVGAARQGAS
jgi:heme A synthase